MGDGELRAWFILLLILAVRVPAHAAPVCAEAFQGRVVLQYDSVKELVSSSLLPAERERWERVVSSNETKFAKKLQRRFRARSAETDQEFFRLAAEMIRLQMEMSLRRSRVSPFLGVYYHHPTRNPELVAALKENYFLLDAIAPTFSDSSLGPAPSKLSSLSTFFYRSLLVILKDNQLNTFRNLSHSDQMLKIARDVTPEQLEAEVGRRIRLDTGIRWLIQHYGNLNLALITAAGLTFIVDYKLSANQIDSLTRADSQVAKVLDSPIPQVSVILGRQPTSSAKQLVQDIAREANPELSPAERDFMNEVATELSR